MTEQRTTKQADDARTRPEVAERVELLVSSMTTDEKVELVTGDLNHNYGFYSAPIVRVGIPELTMADGPPGVRINNVAVHGGKATALPAPIALAATWNLDLARRYGDVLGLEARASGHNVFLGPAVDIARVPVGGRTFESAGEDPIVNARFAACKINAVQSHGVIACLKHYAVNNQEYDRHGIDVQVDERALRELYLLPFEVVVRTTGVGSMMAAFNRVNGSYACEHPRLLNDLLRGEWAFRGWVMSDYGATHSTVPAAMAGLDQEQPSGAYYGETLRRAVETNDLPLQTLNEMCRRILRPMIGLGLFDRLPAISNMPTEAHRAVAQAVAEEAVVLLKNDCAFLPVNAASMRRVVVIGCDADSVGAAGGGSGLINPAFQVSLLDGIRERLGAGVIVDYAQGTDPISAGDLLPGEPSIPSTFFRLEGAETHGIRVQLWTNTELFGDPFAERVLPQVSLNLGFFNYPGFSAASPKYPRFPAELTGRSSARFTGRVVVPRAGDYRLSVAILGTVRIWLDDELVLDFRYHRPDHADGSNSGANFGRHEDVATSTALETSARVVGQGVAHVGLQATELPALVWASPTSGGDSAGPAPDVAMISLALTARTDGHKLRIDYAADAPKQLHNTGAQIRLGWQAPLGLVSHHIEEAVAKARGADLVVVAARCYESEHMDRPSMQLPNGQAEMIKAVAAVNPNTVVVTMSGGPVETLSWEAGVQAILHGWYLGQEQGRVLARLIFGDANPSGKLPVTFPRCDEHSLLLSGRQYPGLDGKVHYEEGLEMGYRGFDAKGLEPRFPFGHGLSYTSFAYDDLEVSSRPGHLSVSCRVTNTGQRAGAEIVQLYLGLPVPNRPPKRLADWAKVSLEPGASQRVAFHVDADSAERPLSIWQDDLGWSVVCGDVQVLVAASSRDVRLQGKAPV